MRPTQWVGTELKRLSRNRFASLAAVVILLIPLLYSFLYLYAFWDPYNHLERIQVAVVNQDVGATRDQNSVHAGKDLADKLKDDHTVGWDFTNLKDAFEGLNHAKYDLVIVIPKDFSQTILDTAKDPLAGQAPQKAKLLYYSNPSKNYLAEQIGNKVAAKLQGDLNGQIAGNFLENVFGSLNDMKRNLQAAAAGTVKLEDGISQAHSGSSEIAHGLQAALGGSDALKQGLESIAAGSGQAAQGNEGLAEGSAKLQDGFNTIEVGGNSAHAGSAQLAAGSSSLVDGLTDANESLQDAANGSAQLYSGLVSAYNGSQDLNAGLAGALSGSGQIKAGADQLYSGLNSMKSQLNSTNPAQAGVPALIRGAGQIAAATSEPSYTPDNPQTITNGVKAAGDGIGQVLSGMNTALPALNDANAALADAKSQLDQALSANPALSSDQHFMTAYNEVIRVQQGLQPESQTLTGAIGGLGQIQQSLTGHSADPLHPTALDGLRNLNSGAAQLQAGLQTLLNQSNSGLDQLVSGSAALAAGSADLNTGLGSAYSGATALSQGLHALTDGGAKLSSGLSSGAASFPALVEGGEALQNGISRLNQGLNDLSQGLKTFGGKLGNLVQEAVKLASGAKALNAGAVQTVSGAASLHDGLVALYDGSASLTNGLDHVQTGSKDLASGLESGVDKLQKDTPQNPAAVSQAMGQPVEVAETQVHPVKNYGTGFAPYFVPLSLWVGALMLFFLIKVKENSLQAAGVSKVKILLGKYETLGLLGAAQAVISSFVIITFLGLQPDNVLEFYGFNILQSLTYVAIIFFLVERFDMAGRFIAIVLLMLQLTSGGGTYPVILIPKFFQELHLYLPMTYGIAALRHIISGSSDIPLHSSVMVLLGFGAAAITLTVLLSPKRLRIKDLHPAPQLGA